MKWLFPFLLFGALLPGCAGTPDTPPVPSRNGPLSEEEQRLQGRWVVVRNEVRKITTPEFHGRVWTFSGRRHQIGSGAEIYRIDEQSDPKRIDFDNRLSPIIQGIYELKGDRLAICAAAPGEPRPATFTTSAFKRDVLTILVREQPAKEPAP